jgi:peptide/nickel transport system ATP-binding protein
MVLTENNVGGTVLRTANLNIGYEDEEENILWVVHDVNISVRRGEFYCIVGESGCGKSTLGNTIVGIIPPYAETRGRLWIDGEIIVDNSRHYYWKSRGRLVSYIPQNPGKSLHPFMSIMEQFRNLYRSHYPGISDEEARRRASETLEIAGLDPGEVLDSYPHELSGGIQQRTAIALAIATGAKLIVADEPTSSLDANLRKQILGLLGRLRRELGITILMITHDMLQAIKTCGRIAVMYAGMIVEEAPAKEIAENPLHPYTRMLLEAVPVLGVRKKLKSIPGEPPRPGELLGGCPFHPRCPYATERCRVEKPPLIEMGEHRVSCRLYT